MSPMPHVPYIATWNTEPLASPEVVEVGTGIGYADEALADRDKHGVLWQRRVWSPGRGRPLFGQVHPLRQRRAMHRLLCWIAVRVGHSIPAGVYGARYRTTRSGPVVVDDATATFDDPAIRWMCAAQLVREITQCTIVDW